MKSCLLLQLLWSQRDYVVIIIELCELGQEEEELTNDLTHIWYINKQSKELSGIYWQQPLDFDYSDKVTNWGWEAEEERKSGLDVSLGLWKFLAILKVIGVNKYIS